MSATRKKVLFKSTPEAKPVALDKSELIKDEKIQWSDELIISDKDSKVVYANRKNIFFTQFESPQIHLLYWKRIFSSHLKLQDKIAVYDTQDAECGYGLMAIDEIESDQFLIYPGAWSFKQPNQTNFDEDTSFLITVTDKNQEPYGFVDSKNYRNLATFAMHSWPKEELDNYQFSSPAIKDSIATANMIKVHVMRPESVTVGPPFVVALMTTQKCRGPLTYVYSDTYFLSVKNINERFFNKNTGTIIDPKYYAVKNSYQIRILDRDHNCYYDLPYSKEMFAYRRDVVAKNPNGTFAVLYYNELKTIIESKLNNRFHIFEKPSVFFKNNAELLAWREKLIAHQASSFLESKSLPSNGNNKNILFPPVEDHGKKLRQLAANESISAEVLNEYLTKMDVNIKKSIINSAGGDTGLTALHRAAEKLNQRKVIVLLVHGADKTLAAKGKTAFDIAEEKGSNESLLKRLKPEISLTNNKR